MILSCICALSALISLGICLAAGGFLSLAWLWILPVGFLGAFLVLGLLAFGIIYCIFQRVDTSVPQEHDDPFYRSLVYHICDVIVPILHMNIHTTGLEKTPSGTRFLLVCNHLSLLDPVVIYYCFRKSQLAFISKQENTNMFIVGKALHRLMGQLLNRENDREALKTILKCVQLLKDDEVSIALFPEGHISKSRHLQKLRSGSLKIATKAHVPIAVCTLQGTEQVFHNALHGWRRTDIQLHVLGVITPEEQAGRTTTDIGEQIYQMMGNDMGPDYAPLAIENP